MKRLIPTIVLTIAALAIGGCGSMTVQQQQAYIAGAQALQQTADATNVIIQAMVVTGAIPAADGAISAAVTKDIDALVPQFDASIQSGVFNPTLLAQIVVDVAQLAAVANKYPPAVAKLEPRHVVTLNRIAAAQAKAMTPK